MGRTFKQNKNINNGGPCMYQASLKQEYTDHQFHK